MKSGQHGSAEDLSLVGRAGTRNVQEELSSFGLGFATGGETISDDEVLGPRFPGSRLSGSHESVSAESFTVNDRLFSPEMGIDWPGIGTALKALPSYNRIVCDATLAVRLAMSGRGVAVVPDLLPQQEYVSKQVVEGVEPVQPRFVFPRRGFDSLTEPEQSLVQQIRKVAEGRCKQETPEPEKDAELIVEALLEETATPMEEMLS